MSQRVYIISDTIYNKDGQKMSEKKISIFSNPDIIRGERYNVNKNEEITTSIPIQDCIYYMQKNFDEEEGYWQYVKKDRILR